MEPETIRALFTARLGEAFAFADLEATAYSYGDVEVTVATPATLYRMKRVGLED